MAEWRARSSPAPPLPLLPNERPRPTQLSRRRHGASLASVRPQLSQSSLFDGAGRELISLTWASARHSFARPLFVCPFFRSTRRRIKRARSRSRARARQSAEHCGASSSAFPELRSFVLPETVGLKNDTGINCLPSRARFLRPRASRGHSKTIHFADSRVRARQQPARQI